MKVYCLDADNADYSFFGIHRGKIQNFELLHLFLQLFLFENALMEQNNLLPSCLNFLMLSFTINAYIAIQSFCKWCARDSHIGTDCLDSLCWTNSGMYARELSVQNKRQAGPSSIVMIVVSAGSVVLCAVCATVLNLCYYFQCLSLWQRQGVGGWKLFAFIKRLANCKTQQRLSCYPSC